MTVEIDNVASNDLDLPVLQPSQDDEVLRLSHAVISEIRTLLRHSSHYFAGLIAKLGLGFVSLSIFTRVFSVADYGLIDFAQKILLFLTACSKLGLQNSALRFFDAKNLRSDYNSARRYYSTMLFGVVLTSVVTALLVGAILWLGVRSLIDPSIAALMGFISVLIVLRAAQSILWSFLRSEEKTKAFNVWTVVQKLLGIAAVCAFLPLFGATAKSFFSGTLAGEFLIAAILIAFLLRRHLLRFSEFDVSLFRSALYFGAPLIFYELSTVILQAADRVLVLHYLGANSLGLYSVAYGLAVQANDFLIFPLNLAILPIYMRLWTTKGRDATIGFLSICLNLYLVVAAGVCAVSMVAARDGLLLLASAKYAGAERIFPLVVIGLLTYTTHIFLCAGLLIEKKTARMASVLITAAVLDIGLNCILLPRVGLIGAALAALVSYVACVIMLGIGSAKLLPLTVPWKEVVKYVTAAAVAAIVASRVSLHSPVWSLAARSIVAIAIYSGIVALLASEVRLLLAKVVRSAQTQAS